MTLKPAGNGEATVNSPALTAREQEVLNLLLAGVIPKEIAASLNISYATVLDHQKISIANLMFTIINELFIKHSKVNGTTQTENVTPAAPGKTVQRASILFGSAKGCCYRLAASQGI